MCKETLNPYIVVVCTVTGTQGREITDRFAKLNEDRIQKGERIMHVRGLTRNKTSAKAVKMQEANPNLSLVDVDYSSSESLLEAFDGADALYINCAMCKDEAKQYELLIDCAVEAKMKHIIYSSSVACEEDHGVPHWETSRHTETYLQKKYEESKGSFKYHMVKFAHCNENLQSYFAPKNGWIGYPWDPSVAIHTASVRDGARVACKMFCDPESLENGVGIDIITDHKTPNEMAEILTKTTGTPTKAYKGPWIFTTFGHWFGFEASSILTMGEYLESNDGLNVKKRKHSIEEYLKDEIKEEPLESVEAYVARCFPKKE